jgi:hypothetical protein
VSQSTIRGHTLHENSSDAQTMHCNKRVAKIDIANLNGWLGRPGQRHHLQGSLNHPHGTRMLSCREIRVAVRGPVGGGPTAVAGAARTGNRLDEIAPLLSASNAMLSNPGFR